MMGIRTPVKKPVNRPSKSPTSANDEAGPSSQSVRKSVGEWEAGKPESKDTSPPKEGTAKEPPKRPIQIALGKTSSEIQSPPTAKSRVAEARSCLTKIKLQLNTTKNTATKIKDEIREQAERLYHLVKEAEQDKGRTPITKTVPKAKESISAEVTTNEKETKALQAALEEHGRKLAENSAKLDRLKEALQTSQDHMEKVSYASVAASQPVRQIPKETALHSIVVTSTDETESGEQVIDHIRKAVNAKEGWVTVDRIRKARDRKIVLGCKTEEERDKIKQKLASVGDHLKVVDVQNKDPLVALKDVLTYNSDEDILKALRNQNGDVFAGLSKEEDRVEVQYKKKTRNPHTHHVVLRVSPKIWNRLQDRQAVHIDLQRIRVSDQSPLVQCSLCLGYGHGRRLCKEHIEKCSHCGGPHMKTQCADWLAGTAPSCCNCVRTNQEQTQHNAFSEECPVRRRWETLARARIAYC